jgi:hypothetical protein
MEEEILKYLEEIKHLDWHTIATLAVLGIILIIANAVTHYFKEKISDRVKVRAGETLTIARPMEPLIRKSDNLISRLCELLLNWPTPKEIAQLKHVLDDKQALEQRLKMLGDLEPSWMEIVAFRFLEFLWASEQFRSKTQELYNHPHLGEIEYFLNDKLPFAMRGKLYNPKGYLTREHCDELELFFLDQKTSSPEGPTFRDMCEALKNDERKRKVFVVLLRYVCFDAGKLIGISNSEQWSPDIEHICAIAHFNIYLIDLFQGLANSPKWEEYRVFLACIVQRGSELHGHKIYLYFKGDLRQAYMLTYPENILRSNFLYSFLLLKVHIPPFWKIRQWAMYWCLRKRARRFIYRHHKKRIRKDGVRIFADGSQYFMKYSSNIDECLTQLKNYLTGTGRRFPEHLKPHDSSSSV